MKMRKRKNLRMIVRKMINQSRVDGKSLSLGLMRLLVQSSQKAVKRLNSCTLLLQKELIGLIMIKLKNILRKSKTKPNKSEKEALRLILKRKKTLMIR